MGFSEHELVTRAQAGDLAAFESLVAAYQQMAFSIAVRIVGDRDGAQDHCRG